MKPALQAQGPGPGAQRVGPSPRVPRARPRGPRGSSNFAAYTENSEFLYGFLSSSQALPRHRATRNQQQANKPTSQEAKKPTSQQAYKRTKNQSKINQKSTKNLPKLVQNWSLGCSWGDLEAILAPKGTKTPQKTSPGKLRKPTWRQVSLKILPKSINIQSKT